MREHPGRKCSSWLGLILLLAVGGGVIRLERLGCLKVLLWLWWMTTFLGKKKKKEENWVFYAFQVTNGSKKIFLCFWLGEKLVQLEREKGIVIRFMIGHRWIAFILFPFRLSISFVQEKFSVCFGKSIGCMVLWDRLYLDYCRRVDLVKPLKLQTCSVSCTFFS